MDVPSALPADEALWSDRAAHRVKESAEQKKTRVQQKNDELMTKLHCDFLMRVLILPFL